MNVLPVDTERVPELATFYHVVSEKLFLIFENMYITSALGSDSFTLKVVPFFSSQFYGK